jgi:GTP-binding protein HflX
VESFKSTLDEVREADFLIHLVDIANPNFEDHINVVNKTLSELGVNDKPTLLVFNKIDAYTFIQKEEDDLTPILPENISLENLKKTWMAKLEGNALFISALNKTHFDELKDVLYTKIKQLHEVRYPYNKFLY